MNQRSFARFSCYQICLFDDINLFFSFGGGGGNTSHGGFPQNKQNGTCKNAQIVLVGLDRIEKLRQKGKGIRRAEANTL